MPQTDSVSLSVEKIIDLIRIVRNDLIKDFLNDDFLTSYYENKYDKTLSSVKREFLKRDLKELQMSSVDLVHYARLINHVKETGTFSLLAKNSDFFYWELECILEKYMV